MVICHFSDYHWMFDRLPAADLYLSTGDHYDNYLRLSRIRKKDKEKVRYLGQDGHGGSYIIDKDYEAQMQKKAAGMIGGFRQYLGNPDAPIVAVRGNHDFTDAKHLFMGCNFVHEIVENEVVEVLGFKITGHRGVPPINGAWQDETSLPDLNDRIRSMDNSCDIYMTHYPPAGLGLDLPGHWGVSELTNWLLYNASKPQVLHVCGHIHECAGKVVQTNHVTWSNAATTWNLLERMDDGWKDVSPC